MLHKASRRVIADQQHKQATKDQQGGLPASCLLHGFYFSGGFLFSA